MKRFQFSESVVKAKSRIALSYPFYSVLMLGMRIENTSKLWSFGTDGKKLYVNDEEVRNWPVPHNIFAFAHECVHCMSGDLWWWRENGYDKKVANVAADHWINLQLDSEGFVAPPGICMDTKFKGWSKLQIYKYLLRHPEEMPQGGGMGDDILDAADPNTLKTDIGIRVKQAAQAAKAIGGHVPQWAEDMIDDLGKPKIPWKQRLAHLAQVAMNNARDDWSYKRQNRRYVPMGIIAPSLFNPNGVGWIVQFTDTSGSMSIEELNASYTEAAGVLEQTNPARYTCIDFDTEVRHVREYKAGDRIVEMEAHGRGGTDFTRMFDWIADPENNKGSKPALVVIMSDMGAVFPDEPPPYPVIWVSTSGVTTAPFGEIININPSED